MIRWSFQAKIHRFGVSISINALLLCCCSADPLKLLSIADPAQTPPVSGNGSSVAPVLSGDGRYVLFASTAKNLVVRSNGASISGTFPTRFNVFRRDRTDNTTILISVNNSGEGGNGDSMPTGISDDGRFALFESTASDLVAGDTNQAADIFVRDVSSNQTILVSRSTNGGLANADSRSSVITPDGRFVAFVSAANNLVVGDTNRIPDIFVRDLQSNTTALVSVGAMAPLGSTVVTESPLITSDGRYIAFYSSASNLVAGVKALPNIYVRDLVNQSTIWASIGASNLLFLKLSTINGVCCNHCISDDGQFVCYEVLPPSTATKKQGLILRFNLISGVTELVHTNAAIIRASFENARTVSMTPDGRYIAFIANTNFYTVTNLYILRWDAFSGAKSVVARPPASDATINLLCDRPTMDASGRYVAFLSSATNLTTNVLTGEIHIYRRDMLSDVTVLVDEDTNGVGSGVLPSSVPEVSSNGGLIAFETANGNLVPDDFNHDFDVFVRDFMTNTMDLISVPHPTLVARTPNGASRLNASVVSADGRYVAFSSEADNLVANDTNGFRDVFLRDIVGNTNLLVSVGTNGTSDGISDEPSLSSDGRFVAFTSRADNLVAGDTNKRLDVFLRDMLNETTSLVSVSTNGTNPGNDHSYFPALSADAKFVLFRSASTDLASGSFALENLFLRDLQSGLTHSLTAGGVLSATMSADGRFALFAGALTVSNTPYLYLWDSRSNSIAYTNDFVLAAPTRTAVSDDGNRLAFTSSNQVFVVDRSANTNWIIGHANTSSRIGLRFSSNGRFLTYSGATSTGATNQVYIYDFDTGTNRLVTLGVNGSDPGNDDSDSPSISGDGRFISFRSAASNLVPGDTNAKADVFLYDTTSASTTLLSANADDSRSADGFSLLPLFAPDGRALLFQSWSSDLLSGDANATADIFTYSLPEPSGAQPFSATAFPDYAFPAAVWITWPVVSGVNYRVQFKDNLNDPGWSELGGAVKIIGSQGYLRDAPTQSNQRFYRVVAY